MLIVLTHRHRGDGGRETGLLNETRSDIMWMLEAIASVCAPGRAGRWRLIEEPASDGDGQDQIIVLSSSRGIARPAGRAQRAPWGQPFPPAAAGHAGGMTDDDD